MKITKGIFREFAYSNALFIFSRDMEQEILFFLSFLDNFIDSSSSPIEIIRQFGQAWIFSFVISCSQSPIRASKLNDIPTAGISLFEYLPTDLSYLPPPTRDVFLPEITNSNMFPV